VSNPNVQIEGTLTFTVSDSDIAPKEYTLTLMRTKDHKSPVWQNWVVNVDGLDDDHFLGVRSNERDEAIFRAGYQVGVLKERMKKK
jgi:hypothetical protein